MQTLYPPNDEDAPGDGDDDVLSQELKNNFNAVRDLLSSNNENEAQTMAIKAALAAEDEIRRLQNGIAELEALLARQQREEEEQLPPLVVAFPSLPPVVVDEEEEEKPGKGELVLS